MTAAVLTGVVARPAPVLRSLRFELLKMSSQW